MSTQHLSRDTSWMCSKLELFEFSSHRHLQLLIQVEFSTNKKHHFIRLSATNFFQYMSNSKLNSKNKKIRQILQMNVKLAVPHFEANDVCIFK